MECADYEQIELDLWVGNRLCLNESPSSGAGNSTTHAIRQMRRVAQYEKTPPSGSNSKKVVQPTIEIIKNDGTAPVNDEYKPKHAKNGKIPLWIRYSAG